MNEIDLIKERLKNKKRIDTPQKKYIFFNNKKLFYFVSKVMILAVLFLGILIFTKISDKNKIKFYEIVYNRNISFASINNFYNKYLGGILPFDNLFKNSEPVFNEKLTYKEDNIYKDGVALTVDNKYLVPALESGIVVFVGDKEEYGKTVVVQQINGIDVWYSNITNLNVKMYDYVEKGSLVAETIDDKLYLIFKKDGKVIAYKDYI